MLFNRSKARFFSTEKNRIALVYGKNGSGNTTISEGISYLKDFATTANIPITVSFFDENCNNLTNADYSNFFVFNERYCENNIKIADSDGLKTILLFGKQAANADSIKKIASKHIKKEKAIEAKTGKKTRFPKMSKLEKTVAMAKEKFGLSK